MISDETVVSLVRKIVVHELLVCSVGEVVDSLDSKQSY